MDVYHDDGGFGRGLNSSTAAGGCVETGEVVVRFGSEVVKGDGREKVEAVVDEECSTKQEFSK